MHSLQNPHSWCWAVVLAAAGAWVAGAPIARADATVPGGNPVVRYNRDVRPILSENCFFCHGPDKAHRKAGLRLDVREAALAEDAFVPGAPEKSELLTRITTGDQDDLMPPPTTHKKVTNAQKEILRRWIAEGAVYEPHWSYVKVTRPPLPTAPAAANPIDIFVRARLAERGLTPSPPADPGILLRRLSLDLVGLPPAPAELQGFRKRSEKAGAAAYRAEVVRLLASPHFGERMAVPWLDVVRFADTVGYHGDQNQNVFPYRDYVIDAFNRNKRFDQFTTEQLAGDLLPRPSVEQRVATGFNRLNMVTREGGAQAKEYLAKYMGDRVRAIGTAFLGSTIGCAECHDHKYDPILARDFYSMGAFFADIREWGVYADYTYTPNPDLAGVGNDHPFPPEIIVDSAFERERAAGLRKLLAAQGRALLRTMLNRPGERAAFAQWQTVSKRFLAQHPTGAIAVTPTRDSVSISNQELTLEFAGDTVVVSGKNTYADTHLTIPAGPHNELGRALGRLATVRVELRPSPQHGGTILRGGSVSDRIYVGIKLQRAGAAGEPPAELKLEKRAGNTPDGVESYSNGSLRFDLSDGWAIRVQHIKTPQVAEFELAQPVQLAAGDVLKINVSGEDIGAFRVALSPFASQGSVIAPSIAMAPPDSPRGLPAFLRKALARPAGKALQGLQEVYLRSAGAAPEKLAALDGTARELHATRNGRVPTLVTVAQAPRTVRVLPRGNWQDDSGALVDPAPPSFLPGWDALKPAGRASRLDLAKWLTSRDNPLTARTFINRLWKQFFGVGLSAVLDDLGAQGETPSHPELLDWLAAEFMDSGWNVKHMVELIVTSDTYRQASQVRREIQAFDPDNRLLARQSQRRLEAEFLRDNALFIAGIITLTVGGPSAKPYQPEGYYDNLEFPQRPYIAHTDGQQFRRGVYTHWQRTFVHPMLTNFDAPSREECTASRPQSNTPQQALTLLNDPTFVEAARVFAGRMLRDEPKLDDDDRLARAFERALGRAPKADETASLREMLAAERRHFSAHPDDARKLIGVGITPPAGIDAVEQAAWTAMCRVILNLYETVTRV